MRKILEEEVKHKTTERDMGHPHAHTGKATPLLKLQGPQLFPFLCAHGVKGPARPFSSCQQRLNGITEGQFQQKGHILIRSTWVPAVTGRSNAWLVPYLESEG